MDLFRSGFPEQVYDAPAGSSPDNGVIDQNDALSLHQTANGVELDIDANLALFLRGRNKCAPDVFILGKPDAVGKPGGFGIPQGRIQTGVWHTDDHIGLHGMLGGEKRTGLLARKAYRGSVNTGIRPCEVDKFKHAEAFWLTVAAPGVSLYTVIADRDDLTGPHIIIITEIDPICALQAAMEGYEVKTLDEVVSMADIFVTTTGNTGIISAAQMSKMKHRAIVGNIGHFDNEIDMAGLKKIPGIKRNEIKPQYDEWIFPDGHSILVLAEGRLLNLGCATGHPSFVMSASFTNQTIAQIDLWLNAQGKQTVAGIKYESGVVYTLPKILDEKVARLHLEKLGVHLTTLTKAQADYIGVPVEGPYKADHYRY